jgi:two-component system, NarL family, nitrate/nitrite response regulator NarL
MRVRIALIDRCQLFREGVAGLLQQHGVGVVASACTLSEVSELRSSELPDAALWSIDSDTDLNASFEALQRARAELPGLRTVVLAHPPDHALVAWAAASGIDAVLSKNISADVLQRSLELVMLGQQVFPPVAPDRPFSPEKKPISEEMVEIRSP